MDDPTQGARHPTYAALRVSDLSHSLQRLCPGNDDSYPGRSGLNVEPVSLMGSPLVVANFRRAGIASGTTDGARPKQAEHKEGRG